MRSHFLAVSFAVAPLVVLFACGGGQPQPVSTPPVASTTAPTEAVSSAAPTASASVVEAPSVWTDTLTKEQKVAMMKQRVVPAMKPLFQAYDAKDFAAFNCKTCHGPDFKLPKDFLPKLHLKDGKLTEFETKPEVAKFMLEKVSPKAAEALGLPHYDPATKQGFGCGGCHTIETK